jgi:translation initiation factor IF-2
MTKLLVKIAKELNVGTVTIVDFLNTKGHDIDNKPNAKITDEMYDVLVTEFQKSFDDKEKSKQINIGNNRPKPAAELETVPPIKEKAAVVDSEEKVVVEDEDRFRVKLPKPTVLGKIDLGSKLQQRVREKTEGSQKKEEEPIPPVVEKVAPVVEAPAARTDQHPVEVEKNSAPPVSQSEAQPKSTPVVADLKPAESISTLDVVNQPVASAPVEEVNQDKPTEKVGEDNFRAVTPELRGLKILGKIDTGQFERPKKKPVVKDAPRGRDGRPINPQAPQQGAAQQGGAQGNNGNRNQPNPNNDPNRQRSQQPGVNDPNRPPRPTGAPANNTGTGNDANLSEAEKKKRKRKRKKVAGATGNNANGTPNANNNAGGNATNNNVGNNNAGNNQNRTGGNQGQGGGTGGNNNNNNNNNRPQQQQRQGQGGGGQGQGYQGGGNNRPNTSTGNRPNTSTGNRPPVQREENKEVSKREIEDQIKATMARLSGGGKKKRQKLQRDKRERFRERQEAQDLEASTGKLQLTEFISVQDLANLMDVAVTEVITTCMALGVIVSINQRLDAEIIELVAEEFGHEVEFISVEEQLEDDIEVEDDPADMISRAPIVTVMGHVDHGKTSLLDFVRKANVVSGEAGGITQHIGAYEVVLDGDRKITFLDTPGHEAFTAMRARGAKVTDIAIIIIAADDSIMPQTKEAISHAQAANVPMVFAINKVDKAGAQPEKIKQELAAMNFLVEDWGGKYQSQDISAKTGLGIPELMEKILLEAELLELKANPNRNAVGAVLEASLDKGRGYITKMLVQSGALHIGDSVVAGEFSGKVRAMLNERGKRLTEAGPSTPVMVLGLGGAPQAGDRFKVLDDDAEARQIASRRAQISREQATRSTKRISLDEIGRRLALGSFKELNLIVKGDVDGSVEALSDSLIKLGIESVQVNVIHRAVGQIIESDILLASASDAIVIGFQVRPSTNARKLAEREGVEIKYYSIIYEAIDEVKLAIEGMLEPTKEEKITGLVEIREVYKISKVGTVAGCIVSEGKIARNSHIRVVRDGIVVFPTKDGAHGEVSSLKRFKEDVREVKSGLECGLTIKNYNDIKANDVVEVYEIVEIKQSYG